MFRALVVLYTYFAHFAELPAEWSGVPAPQPQLWSDDGPHGQGSDYGDTGRKFRELQGTMRLREVVRRVLRLCSVKSRAEAQGENRLFSIARTR